MSTDKPVRELLGSVARLFSVILALSMMIFGLVHYNRKQIPEATFDMVVATFAVVLSRKESKS